MTHAFFQIDAFTDRPFAGNPAAVLLLPEPGDDGWMQAVAAEMNVSETAFLVRRPDDAFDLRWFTPAAEVDLCGHATLASAHMLWEQGHLAPDAAARFHTRSGELGARRDDAWIELDFPACPVRPDDHAARGPALLEALGTPGGRYLGSNGKDQLIVLATEADVMAVKPDFKAVCAAGGRGVIITALAAPMRVGIDFVSRFFAPMVGIDEDPVTGSAHCCLGPYWADALGRDTLVGEQVSARGGTVRVTMRGDRVGLGGQAVTVMSGELRASLTS